MAELTADARPEKRLFISLLTRDIPLIAAFLDLLDNSINAAVEPHSDRLKTAADYMEVFEDEAVNPAVSIKVELNTTSVSIRDNAAGISAKTAVDHVFKFGRGSNEAHESDRLSVYGIGLKRAMFKLGNKILMTSDHVEGGFDLDLTVSDWANDASQPWTFKIRERSPVLAGQTGTTITISELHREVISRIGDGLFEGQLCDAVSRTYAYYLAKFISVTINANSVDGVSIEVGSNRASEIFSFGGVSCAVIAGLGTPQGGVFRDKSSGWFVFCNGRAVISADKSVLTGWGGGAGGLPLFQPKHRPFLGTVFFVAEDAELLPWTTTKASINEDSEVWQQAKRQMASIGRVVVSFLDSRYTDEGTEVASKELQLVSREPVSVLKASISQRTVFEPPKARSTQTTTRIQYDAELEQIKAVAHYLKKPSMSGSEIGRYTFNHFVRNEVGEA